MKDDRFGAIRRVVDGGTIPDLAGALQGAASPPLRSACVARLSGQGPRSDAQDAQGVQRRNGNAS